MPQDQGIESLGDVEKDSARAGSIQLTHEDENRGVHAFTFSPSSPLPLYGWDGRTQHETGQGYAAAYSDSTF